MTSDTSMGDSFGSLATTLMALVDVGVAEVGGGGGVGIWMGVRAAFLPLSCAAEMFALPFGGRPPFLGAEAGATALVLEWLEGGTDADDVEAFEYATFLLPCFPVALDIGVSAASSEKNRSTESPSLSIASSSTGTSTRGAFIAFLLGLDSAGSRNRYRSSRLLAASSMSPLLRSPSASAAGPMGLLRSKSSTGGKASAGSELNSKLSSTLSFSIRSFSLRCSTLSVSSSESRTRFSEASNRLCRL